MGEGKYLLIKRSFVWQCLLVFLLCLVFEISCKKQTVFETNTNAKEPLISLIKNDFQFSLFYHGLVKTGYDTIIATGGPYTILGPDNTAFKNSGITADSMLDALAPDELKKIIGYHIINKQILFSNVLRTLHSEYQSINGFTLYFSKAISINPSFPNLIPDLHINGKLVKQRDLLASDGVIQKVDSVLMPPRGTIKDILDSDSSFSILARALKKFGLYDQLSGKGPFTLFAPRDNAFIKRKISKIGDSLVYSGSAVDTLHYKKILFSVYVVDLTRLFLSDLADAPPQDLSGTGFSNFFTKDYIISIDNGNQPNIIYVADAVNYDELSIRYLGASYVANQPTRLVNSNQVATNGVIQGVSDILIYPKNVFIP